jgi:hypothetical protein
MDVVIIIVTLPFCMAALAQSRQTDLALAVGKLYRTPASPFPQFTYTVVYPYTVSTSFHRV